MNQDSKEQAVPERSPLSLRLEAIWDIDSAAEAIEFKGKRYTWGQLRTLALEVNSLLDAAGIGQGLIRVAVGLEHLDDIKADLALGLDTLS